MSVQSTSLFQRQATGLVREAGTWSTLIYNINFVSIGLMMLFVLQLEPAFYPGGNMLVSYLMALAVVLPTSFVFAMFAAAMPRSGGDYVYVSRILGPRLGMMSSFINTVWWFIYGGVPSAFFARYGLGPLCRNVGIMSGNQALIDLGAWFVTPEGTIITGILLVTALVVAFSLGLHVYFRVQNALFVVAMVGLAVIGFVLLTGSNEQFQANLATYSGVPNAYQDVIDAATATGFTEAPFSWYWSLIPITWIYLELVFNQSSAYIGGEIKRASRIQLWSMPLTAVICVGVAMLLTWLFQQTIGTTFLGAVSWDAGATIGLSSAPTFSELAAYMSGSTIVAVIVGIGFVFWSYTWLPGQILNASRNLLAYSVDGVFPARFGSVNERYHTPVFSLVIVGLGSIAALIVYATNSDFTTLTGIVAFIVSFIIVSIAAILFPRRKRDVWAASPVAWTWGGLPVISIAGVVSLAALIVTLWVFLNDPLAGVFVLDGFTPHFTDESGALTKDSIRLLITIGTVLSGLVVFEVSRIIRARRGVRLEAAFEEIPVE